MSMWQMCQQTGTHLIATPSNVIPLPKFALRSLPTIPHSHVFVRKRTLSNASRRALQASRRGWRERSPWLNAAVEEG